MAVATAASARPLVERVDYVDVSVNVPTRRASSIQLPRWLRKLGGPAILVLIWSAITYSGLVNARIFATPGDVVAAGSSLIQSGNLGTHLLASLQRSLTGLSYGIAAGVSLATIAGLTRLGDDLIDSTVQVWHSFPVVALIPLFIVWMGIGEQTKITVIAIGTAYPIYINTYGAIRNLDSRLVDMARSFGVTRLGLVRDVILPGAVPGFLVGLRTALVGSLLILIFVEQINAVRGIGVLMNEAQALFRTDVIIFLLSLYGLYGLLSVGVVRGLERLLLSWRRGFSA